MTITLIKGIMAVLPTASSLFNEVSVNGNYVAASSDNYIYMDNTTSGPVSVTLPYAPVRNQFLVVKDVAGNAGAHHITIIGTVDGVVNPVLSSNYMVIGLTYAGGLWWQIF